MESKITASNLAELYGIAAEKYGDLPAFSTKNSSGVYEAISYKELYERGLNLATALIDLGVEQREHVALLADNRLEWIIVDYGVLLCGAADVPRGSDVTDHDIQYIVHHSDSRVVFVENTALAELVEKNRNHLPQVKHVVVMDKESEVADGVLRLEDLLAKGAELRAGGDRRAEDRISAIKPDDLFTLIYTSGTTGEPKGVMLMHSNMISQVRDLPINIGADDRLLSILPIWHIFERVVEMLAIGYGACTYYTNVRSIGEDLKTVKPTFMGSAPRLWENVYKKIVTKIEKGPEIKQKLFNAASFCAQRFQGGVRFLTGVELDITGRNLSESILGMLKSVLNIIVFFVPYKLLDAIVLKKIREATGGELKGSISGGGALPLHVDQFFNNIGVPVLEGYGLTETCPVLAVRTFDKLVIGSVGPLYKNTEIRLVEPHTTNLIYPPHSSGRGKKGEIHVKGPQVMKGYYKNPTATSKVLSDGWFNTGDLGVITYNDTLKIVGRSKETIVLLGGENLEPVPIESKLQESPLIDQVMLVGQDQKQVGALIVPSLDAFKDYGSTLEELSNNEDVIRQLKGVVKDLISSENGFKPFERIGDIRLLSKPFELGDELTNKYSIKRHVITEKYDELIKSMYK